MSGARTDLGASMSLRQLFRSGVRQRGGALAGRIAASLGELVPGETVAPMLMITSRVPH
jgi:hypothetical protein